ncbi:IPTL-CTERM sorting domain-containing protein [Comamonas sp. JUb58]|uniref:IPTL-CTERM sorting domain-containing protein n=1 Tax=Comamonas sp. JUb58 TaxID=2485114 RepID=UPI001061C85F|nr:IPTL-CTERM sorting domain-containing protein [Comamonas sp. JUb58]TDS85229.1 putative secreted protein (IPTL-CTERM system target) [Comamonas sp. JUb58]
MAHFSMVNGAADRRKAQQGRKASKILKALPAALLAWSGMLGMAQAAVYAPDNFANAGGSNLETMVMVKDGSGRVVIGGLFNTVEGQAGYQGVARFNTDDSLDTGFKVATNDFVKAIAVQPDGKLLVGGEFTAVKPQGAASFSTFWGIARLNADGTLDAGFQNAPAGSVKANGNVRGIALQPDGKIIIGGYFNRIDGSVANRVARLNADGTLDATFNVGTGPNNGIEDVKLQPDGKILISGTFSQVNGVNRMSVARLNADGSVDDTFDAGQAIAGRNGAWDGSWPVYQLALQNDGKIVYAGGTHRYADEIHWRIARLNTDGTVDSSFQSYVNWWASSVALQNVGGEQKIVVGGDYGRAGVTNPANGAVVTDAPRQRIARFNADGSLDTEFDTSFSANSWVWTVLPNDDGTVYLGGKFTSVAGMARRGIARLAELDPTKQVINFLAPEPGTYSALNGSSVSWNPTPPTTSSANLPVTYSSVTPTVCTVNASTGAATLVVPAVTGLCTIEANAAAGTQTINGLTYNVDPAPAVRQGMQIDAPPDQSITFPEQTSPRNVTAGTFSIDPVATASSGLAVSYTSLTPAICTVAGTTVTPVSGGLCTIAANQPGGNVGAVAFNAAAQVTQSVTVQSAQTISFPAQTAHSVVTGSSFALAPAATASSGLAVSYTSLTPAVCTVSGASVRVLSTGTCSIEANQEGNAFFTVAEPVTQSITVTALPAAATPVPTLGTWALALLAAMLGFVGLRRRA